MAKRLLFLFLLITGIWVNAQQDSLLSKSQAIFDSLSELSSRHWLTDSLSVLAWGDSVQNGVARKAAHDIAAINNKIDSLNQLQLPTSKLQSKIDSINQRKDKWISEVNSKRQSLLDGTKKKITDWQSKIKTKLGLNDSDLNSAAADVTGKPIGDLNLPTDQMKVQELNLPTKELNLSMDDLKIPGLEAVDFQNLDLPTDLQSLNQSLPFSNIDGLSEWQDKISDVTGNVSGLRDIKTNPDKILENAAGNISQVSDAQKVLNTNALDQSEYGAVLKNANDEEAMKKMLTNQVKKEALNHFAGKEQVLQSAMEQISKYKKSYSSVNSLSEIKKLPKNTMKGKPFRERFIPGFGMQIHVKNYLNFDINPYAAYMISGNISAGVGWNQRFAMDWDNKSWVPDGRVFGPRVFTDYKLKRGFSIRLEGEAMNTSVPPYYLTPGESKREWVFTTMTGLKKDYRFFNRVRGFTLVQFDIIKIFVPNHHSAYGDVVNARFGFEFPLKKKPAKKTEQDKSMK